MIRITNRLKAIIRRARACLLYVLWKIAYGNRISIKGLPILGGKVFIHVFKDGTISIGKGLSTRRDFEVRATGKVCIGDGCFFNNYCTITANRSITIGDNCIFGERVSIFDHDHGFRSEDQLIKNQRFTVSEVVLGNNIWVGSNVIILKGVHIGDNAVIGANCVVYKDVPANTLVKAKVLQDYIEYKEAFDD